MVLYRLTDNPRVQRRNLLSRKPQSQLGPAPQHVFGGAGPFAVDQIGDLALAQAVPEVAPQIVAALCIAKDPARQRAIGAGQAQGLVGAEEGVVVRLRCAQFARRLLGEIAPGQRLAVGPVAA